METVLPIMSSDDSLFIASGRLYLNGLRGWTAPGSTDYVLTTIFAGDENE
jgi:hypothetical protein